MKGDKEIKDMRKKERKTGKEHTKENYGKGRNENA